MQSPGVLRLVVSLAAAAVCAGCGNAAAGGGAITIDNQSAHAVKVAVPGGAARILAPGGPAESIVMDAEEGARGTTVRLWWVSDPLQLCQIVTPWERTVTVTGDSEIHCRSR